MSGGWSEAEAAARNPPADGWSRLQFEGVDAHHAAIRGARPNVGWTSNQLSPARIQGSILSRRSEGLAVTCTRSTGDYELRGPLSVDGIALSVALAFPRCGYQWMQPVVSGLVGLAQAGVDIDSVVHGDVRYVTIDASLECLEWEARQQDHVLPPNLPARSRIVAGRVGPSQIDALSRMIETCHDRHAEPLPPGMRLDRLIFSIMVDKLCRAGDGSLEVVPFSSHHRILARARAYIEAHLDQPIAIDDLAAASYASRRTLHRAFVEVLGETPIGYVLKLRLNRIRQELASPDEALRTVTTVSLKWGVGELGRLAARYRSQFDELPSETLARRGMQPARAA